MLKNEQKNHQREDFRGSQWPHLQLLSKEPPIEFYLSNSTFRRVPLSISRSPERIFVTFSVAFEPSSMPHVSFRSLGTLSTRKLRPCNSRVINYSAMRRNCLEMMEKMLESEISLGHNELISLEETEIRGRDENLMRAEFYDKIFSSCKYS